MDRALRLAAVFLGLVIVTLSFFQRVDRESVLPLGTDVIASINFADVAASEEELKQQLSALSSGHKLEIYQARSSDSDLSTDLVVRGQFQPAAAQEIRWLDPLRTGSLYPAAHSSAEGNLDLPVSGLYLIKGGASAQQAFRAWLEETGAVFTWAKFTSLELFLRPLQYQGVVVLVVVSLIIIGSVVLGWFARQSYGRGVRILGGKRLRDLHCEDCARILKPVVMYSAVSVVVCQLFITLWRGLPALSMIPNEIVMLLLAWLGIFASALLISILTAPSIATLGARKPLPWIFSALSLVAVSLVAALTLLAVPGLQLTAQRAEEFTRTAQKASSLPESYGLNFGAVEDASRDYDAKIKPVAQAIREQISRGQVLYSEVLPPHRIPPRLRGIYDRVLMVDASMFAALEQHSGAPFMVVEDSVVRQAFLGERPNQIASRSEPGGGEAEAFGIYTPAPGGDPELVGINSSGFYESVTAPLIVRITDIAAYYPESKLVSLATTNKLSFRSQREILDAGTSAGLSVSLDNLKSVTNKWAEDSRRSAMTAQVSMGALLIALIICIVTGSYVYVARKARTLLPNFLAGESPLRLAYPPLLVPLGILLIASVGAAGVGFYLGVAQFWLPVVLGCVIAVAWLAQRTRNVNDGIRAIITRDAA